MTSFPTFRRGLASLAAVCSGLLIAAAAQAQVVLFDRADLQGSKITVRAEEPALSGSDFNDKAQSILVQGGEWEVCLDDNFRGDCMRLQPGEYRNLDRRFVKSISSLRPVGAGNAAVYQGQGPGSPPPAAPQAAPAPTTVIVAPPAPPSSCSIGKTETCPACSITCTGGQKSFCKPGYEYNQLGKMTCEFKPTCECRPGG